MWPRDVLEVHALPLILSHPPPPSTPAMPAASVMLGIEVSRWFSQHLLGLLMHVPQRVFPLLGCHLSGWDSESPCVCGGA